MLGLIAAVVNSWIRERGAGRLCLLGQVVSAVKFTSKDRAARKAYKVQMIRSKPLVLIDLDGFRDVR